MTYGIDAAKLRVGGLAATSLKNALKSAISDLQIVLHVVFLMGNYARIAKIPIKPGETPFLPLASKPNLCRVKIGLLGHEKPVPRAGRMT